MAKITFQKQSEYFSKLQQLDRVFAKESTLEKAVYAGAEPVADAIRSRLQSLGEDEFRHLQPGEVFSGLPEDQKNDLLNSFGLSSIKRDGKGYVGTKAGFDGYGSHPTKSYPNGVPNALIARAAESGSSVRRKTPFVRPAVTATKEQSITAMERVIDDEIKKIF